MQFVEKYEPIVRMIDDSIVAMNLYDSYEEANDAVIQLAASDLPTENVKAYQINKVYVNAAVWGVMPISKGGI